jgi:hypothetical protein
MPRQEPAKADAKTYYSTAPPVWQPEKASKGVDLFLCKNGLFFGSFIEPLIWQRPERKHLTIQHRYNPGLPAPINGFGMIFAWEFKLVENDFGMVIAKEFDSVYKLE